MRYTRREVRMIDMFALVLAGAGGLFVILGFVIPRPVYVEGDPLVKGGTRVVSSKSPKSSKDGKPAKATAVHVVHPGKGKATPGILGSVHPLLLIGCCFIALGTALHLGVRAVLRNRLEDVLEPDAESGKPRSKDAAI